MKVTVLLLLFHPYLTYALVTPILSIPNVIDTLTSGLASISRMPRGVSVLPNLPSDVQSSLNEQLILYDLEGNRNCRVIREVISELDLVVTIVPRPKYNVQNNTKNKSKTKDVGVVVEDLVPQLEVKRKKKGDSMVLNGNDVIKDYLYSRYTGPGFVEPVDDSNIVTDLLPSILRLGRGKKLSCAVSGLRPRPKSPIVLYSYEGNQFCRLVREVLSELGISYELRSAGKGSPRRDELMIVSGATQCPYLVDPNTGTKMGESKEIIKYLYQTYALFVPPNEALQLVSTFVMPLLKPFFAILAPLQAGEYDKGQIRQEIEEELQSSPVVIYTYKLSPFCIEALDVLKNIGIDYKEVSLGFEWVPGLIAKGGAAKRAELGRMTGQTSLPHIFVGGQSIGGLFSGKPGLIPSLEKGSFTRMLKESSPPLTRTLNL